MIGQTSLASISTLRDCTSHRISSYDTTGGNADFWQIDAGKTKVIGEISGPGCIKHLWMTLGIPQEDYCRRIIIRIYWDGCKTPSVECPIGDFFGLGHGMRKNFITAPLQMSPQNGKGFNAWWPMPFKEKAVIEIENQGDEAYAHYFYIDYESYPSVDAVADQAYFHTQWHMERNTEGWAYEEGLKSDIYRDDHRWYNLSDKDNFVMCDVEGNGVYCGAHLDIDCFQRNPNDWYGEGDDMMFIDGEAWPPSLHGTGTEDWYHCAYCPTQEYNAPYHGIILYSGSEEWRWKGKNTVYRYHIEDPIRFRKSFRMSIEHGHANKLSNDYASTAYYYLTEPQQGGPSLPPVEMRLPRPDEEQYEGR